MKYPEVIEAIETINKLRDPQSGCPWDLEQTHESLLRYLTEESYEFIEAVERKDYDDMQEELGDVLLQVILHAKIASEQNKFDMNSVAKTLKEKIVERHPHVFANQGEKLSAEQVQENWQANKQRTKQQLMSKSLLRFPALFSSFKIGKKTEKINFDWEDYSQVVYKVEEEWQELKEELTPHRQPDMNRIEEELGDFLFSTAQLARHLGLNPEETLRKANKKFLNRFQKMEQMISDSGRSISTMNQNEMDEFWQQVKEHEKS